MLHGRLLSADSGLGGRCVGCPPPQVSGDRSRRRIHRLGTRAFRCWSGPARDPGRCGLGDASCRSTGRRSKRLGELGDRPPGLDQVQDLAAELGWIPPSFHAGLLSVGQHGIQQRDSTELGKDHQVPDRAGQTSVTEACRTFGVSRTTYYRWAGRAQRYGLVALVPKSRRPPVMPTAAPPTRSRRCWPRRSPGRPWAPASWSATSPTAGCACQPRVCRSCWSATGWGDGPSGWLPWPGPRATPNIIAGRLAGRSTGR